MNNKKSTTVTIIAIVALLIMLVSATYAFFQAQGGNTVTRNVNVLTHTVDTLSFSVSNDISIEADQFNFMNGGANHESSENGAATKAKLKADLENNLGTTLDDSSCSSNSKRVSCTISTIVIEVYSFGKVSILNGRDFGGCFINSEGSSYCS